MALTIPTPSLDTFTSGQLLTADLLNANVRDVQRFLAYAPLTIVQRAAAQSIADSAQATITWDTEVVDVDGMFNSPSTNLTVQRPGVYAIQFEPLFVANGNGAIRSGHIAINGTWVSSANNAPSGTDPTALNMSAIVALNTGDVVTGMVFQNSGGALNVGTLYNAPRMSVRLMSTANLDVNFTNATPPASKPPTAHVPTSFTKTYQATWSRTFDGDNTVTWDDSPYCYQGFYDNNRGNTRSLVGFNSAAIRNDLKGASNIHVYFVFKVAHSYYNSGMTALIGTHNYSSKPSTWSGATVNERQKSRSSCSAGHVYTIDLGKNTWYGWAFQNNVIKGMAFGPGPNTNRTYYGYSYGASQGGKPYLRITYTK